MPVVLGRCTTFTSSIEDYCTIEIYHWRIRASPATLAMGRETNVLAQRGARVAHAMDVDRYRRRNLTATPAELLADLHWVFTPRVRPVQRMLATQLQRARKPPSVSRTTGR